MSSKRPWRLITLSAWWEGSTYGGIRVATFSLRLYERRSNLEMIESISIQEIDYHQARNQAELYGLVMRRIRDARRRLRHRWRVKVLGANYQKRLSMTRAKSEAMASWERHSAPRYEASEIDRERAAFSKYLDDRWGPTPAREDASIDPTSEDYDPNHDPLRPVATPAPGGFTQALEQMRHRRMAAILGCDAAALAKLEELEPEAHREFGNRPLGVVVAGARPAVTLEEVQRWYRERGLLVSMKVMGDQMVYDFVGLIEVSKP